MQNIAFNQIFQNSNGKTVLIQMPNLLILVWIGATLLQMVFTIGRLHMALNTIAFGALFAWAWQELFQGVNYFRKGLGLLVLVGTILSGIG
jgi:hypothetical protein